MPIVLMNRDDATGALTFAPMDSNAVVAAINEMLPRLRFSDLNRLRLDTIPRVLREKAKALAAAQGLDVVAAMRAAGMEPDDDGPAGSPVLLPPDGTDPTSGLPAFVPEPMPEAADDEDDESDVLEPTTLVPVEPFDPATANKGSAEECVTIQ